MNRYDYDDLGWDEDHCPPADPDPAYECTVCWWLGNEPPVGQDGYLVCEDCGSEIDDYEPR